MYNQMKRITLVITVLCVIFNASAQLKNSDTAQNKIDELFQSYHHYNRFIGSVLISKNDKIIYQNSYGDANLKFNKKNNEHTIYKVASLTKPITAVAIMKLIEAGKLTLDTRLSLFFSDFLNEYSNNITVRHLLNHSSGMQANIGRDDNTGMSLAPNEKPTTFNALQNKFKDSKLKFEPGTHYDYNNFGYMLLAQIIERVSGLSYQDYIEESIFKPLGMDNTTAKPNGNAINKAIPYTGLGMDVLKSYDLPIDASWIKGAGDISSTVLDLHKFLIALENHEILSSKSVDKLYDTKQSMEVNDRAYGLGWVNDQKYGEKWIYHDGLLPGFASIMGILPDSGVKIVILSNATSTNPMDDFQGKIQFVDNEIVDKVIAILKDQDVSLLPIPSKNKTPEFDSKSKLFQLDDKHIFEIEKQNNEYWLEATGEESWSIFTYGFAQDAKENNQASKIALYFAQAMKNQSLTGLVDYADEQMKGFLGSEEGLNQLRGMWSNMLKQAGDFKSFNIYNIEGDEAKNVYLRFHFKAQDVGLVLSVNKTNKIQGMFMDEKMRTSNLRRVKLIPLGNNEFFIDGHKNGGYQDVRLKIVSNTLLLIDTSNTFKATLLSSN
jgi:CubicO group peptidase (beta-lactamase class C family)